MKKKILISSIFFIIILIVFISIFLGIRNKQKQENDILIEGIVNDPNKNIEQEEIIDNSIIGTLTIPKINLVDEKICESVELETLSHSIGHFESTNIYNGNVGLASHNAGIKANYFADINKLELGDEIYYKTRYGTKNYVVNSITQIKSDDWSYLEHTEDNRITLITCISGNPNLRLCVQGVEK